MKKLKYAYKLIRKEFVDSPKDLIFGGTTFFKTDLKNRVVEGAEFDGVVFMDVDAECTIFKNCVFKNMVFDGLMVKKTVLDECQFVNVDITCDTAELLPRMCSLKNTTSIEMGHKVRIMDI